MARWGSRFSPVCVLLRGASVFFFEISIKFLQARQALDDAAAEFFLVRGDFAHAVFALSCDLLRLLAMEFRLLLVPADRRVRRRQHAMRSIVHRHVAHAPW